MYMYNLCIIMYMYRGGARGVACGCGLWVWFVSVVMGVVMGWGRWAET